MYKLVVLCSVLAVASAKPGLWGSGLIGSGLGLGLGGVVSSPVISAYSAGISPIGLGVSPIGLGVSGWGASPLVSTGLIGASEPALAPGVPGGLVLKATGKPVDTLDVVVAKNNHLVAKNLAYHGIQKRSAVAPLALSTGLVSSPLALSSPLGLGINSGLVSPLGLNSGLIGARSIVSPLGLNSGLIGAGSVVSPWGVNSGLIGARSIVSPLGLNSGLIGAPIGSAWGVNAW